jgi:hypothetical protein
MCCPMSSTTNPFVWTDRDTAARNMLQFANCAPPSIRLRAVQLLEAFRSPAILSELKQIVLGEVRNPWERGYALQAIASISDDIHLPEFEALVSDKDSTLNYHDFLRLLSDHPSNFHWVFRSIEQLPPQEYLEVLDHAYWYFYKCSDLKPVVCQRMLDVLEHNPLLLKIDYIEALYLRDGSEVALNWLHKHWDLIIALCLSMELDNLFGLLGDWDELREALFRQCPSCIETYQQKKKEAEALDLRR